MKGYNNYRGRRQNIKIAATVALVVVLLLSCIILLASRYIAYGDDGEIRLELPFLQNEQEPPQPEDDGEEVHLVVDDPQTGSVEELPREEEAPHRLIHMDKLPADREQLVAEVEDAGATGFVYTVKDDTGKVFYHSAAAQRDASGGADLEGEEIAALCAQNEPWSAARLNCFHDSYYAYVHMEKAGICQSNGYVWYDWQSYHWLDPAKESARRYVISLALECVQMGFDELILEEMYYPPSGNLQKISYESDPSERAKALTLFLEELRTALAPYDVRISLMLPRWCLPGDEQEEKLSASCLVLENVLPLVDGVYAPGESEEALRELLRPLLGEEEMPVVTAMTEELPEEGSWYLSE